MTTEAFYRLPQDEQDLQIAKWHRDKSVCPQCGRPGGECADPNKDWFPQRSICYATLELVSANARYEALHKDRPYHDGTFEDWVKEPSRSHPYRFDEAVNIWVASVDLNPDDDFLGGRTLADEPPDDDGQRPEDADDGE